MKLLRLLKNNKGVTLIELLVGIGLLTLLLLMVGTVITPMFAIQRNVSERAELNTILDNVSRVMLRDLSAATDTAAPTITCIGGCSPDPFCECATPDPTNLRLTSGSAEYRIDAEGVLLRNGRSVLSKAFLTRKSLEFGLAINTPAAGMHTLILIVTDDTRGDSEMTRREYVVRPLALTENRHTCSVCSIILSDCTCP